MLDCIIVPAAMDQNIHWGKPDFSEYCGWSFIDSKDSVAY